MTPESKVQRHDRATAFIEYLLAIAERQDRGALAALRRSLQQPNGIAMSACPYVVPFLASASDSITERTFFLVGALFALHPEHEQGSSLGHVFRRINGETPEGKAGKDNESVRGRFVALLDAHPDDIAEHLRHAVSLARARTIALDWVRTLKDLLSWRAPERWVQRRLASDFWRPDTAAMGPTAPSEKPSKQESENRT